MSSADEIAPVWAAVTLCGLAVSITCADWSSVDAWTPSNVSASPALKEKPTLLIGLSGVICASVPMVSPIHNGDSNRPGGNGAVLLPSSTLNTP